MRIHLENIGKRYNYDWIFRHVDLQLEPGSRTAILGSNGSGKSTLLQLIAGASVSSEGTISYTSGDQKVDAESIYRHTAIAAPYLELFEELTLAEAIDVQEGFKRFNPADAQAVIDVCNLREVKDRPIRYFSSGMKQRVRLALALMSDATLVLLDEPTSNLDAEGISWYRSLIDRYAAGRTIVVASNQLLQEYEFCKQEIRVSDFSKKSRP